MPILLRTWEPEPLPLLPPVARQFLDGQPIDRQARGFPSFYNGLDDVWRQQGQADHAADVGTGDAEATGEILLCGIYACVVIPVSPQHYMMLQRNLIYTGLTRGRKMVMMIGAIKVLAMPSSEPKTPHAGGARRPASTPGSSPPGGVLGF